MCQAKIRLALIKNNMQLLVPPQLQAHVLVPTGRKEKEVYGIKRHNEHPVPRSSLKLLL